jgi:hypothetical protein
LQQVRTSGFHGGEGMPNLWYGASQERDNQSRRHAPNARSWQSDQARSRAESADHCLSAPNKATLGN